MPDPDEYTIGWICAIRTELVAATAFLDEKHDDPDHLPVNDDNAYVLGRIGKHNVVIAALPHGQYGLVSAANVARDLLRSFTNVRVGLMVGIGGGAPSQKHDIRLGDVVVGSPGNGRGGVLQYDYGKTIQGKDFEFSGHLNQPPQCLLTALTVLGAQYEIDGHNIQAQIDGVLEKKPRLRVTYKKPDAELDRLYMPSFEHAGSDNDCCATTCDNNSKLIARTERSPEQDSPMIHYGLIASANQLMKDAQIRDQLSAKEDILCFEMEAAGLVNSFPCIIIRGICDYSDTHKNKVWQGYAAMVAAAFAKNLLQKLAPNKVAAEKRLTEVLSDVNTTLSIISGSLGQSQKSLEGLRTDRHTEKLMRWLAAADVSSNLKKAIETRHRGSGQRLIECEAYTEWKRNSGSFLWLNGIPGCGKTILASTVIKDLESDPACSGSLLYYYFDFTDAQKQDFKTAIRSLLTQLYLKFKSAKASLDLLYSSCKNGWEQPNIGLLESTFANIVKEVGGLYIVIDALDECLIRHELLEWLRDLRAEQMNAHIIVTSRPEQDIRSAFDRFCCKQEIVTIRDELLEDDIRNYVRARVREHDALSRWRKRPDIQQEIETELIQKANGMFRWVACQLDSLEKCCDPKTLRFTLASLPKTLDETYARILANIPPEHMHHAIRLLQFLTYSERPLRVDEAVDAIAVEVGPQLPRGSCFDPKNRMPIPAEISVYCSSLVVLVRRELNRTSSRTKYILEELQLAHFSVKDYLISNRLGEEVAQHLKETSAQSLMAEVCLTYLLELDSKTSDIQQKKAFPFSEYSANYWANYAAMGEQNSIAVRKLAIELLQSPISVSVCCQLQTRFWEPPSGGTASALYYASLLGLPLCVHMLLEDGADINAHGGSYGGALQAASAKGHMRVVQLLIENGANIFSKSGRYGSALRAAIAGRHGQIIQVLRGNKRYTYDTDGAGSPFSHIDLERVDERGPQLLTAAVINGDTGLVDLLLDLDVAPETNEHKRTLSYLAAREGNIEVLELLFDRGFDCFAADDTGRSPLSAAAFGGYYKVVKLLLDRGADLSVTDKLGWNALHSASDQGYAEIAKLLLQEGADSSVTTEDGWAPLSVAAKKGYVRLVKLLLETRPNRSTLIHHGNIAIHSAALRGHSQVVQLLLENGVDAMARDRVGRSILIFAIKSGSDELFSMLLDQIPLLVDLKDHYGSTALSVASRFGRTDMVKRIAPLTKTDLSFGDKFGRTALWWARTQKHDDIASYITDLAEQSCIVIPEADLPVGKFAAYTSSGNWCDVCMSYLERSSIYLQCKLCLEGEFYVCLNCKHLGAHCLVGLHILERYKHWNSRHKEAAALHR